MNEPGTGELIPGIQPSELTEVVQNKWEQNLRKQGIPMDIPDGFKTIPLLDKQGITPVKDRLTGLPIEDNHIRKLVTTELSSSIRGGENWAAVYGDGDNVKPANDKIDRKYGDMVIRYGASRVLTAIDSLNLSPNVKIISARQADAADETITWIFGLSQEELRKLREAIEKGGEGINVSNPSYTFSVSATVLGSDDSRFEAKKAETAKWLLEDPSRNAYDFYQELAERVEADVKAVKMAKDHIGFTISELLEDGRLRQLRELIMANHEDTRISGTVLKDLIDLVAAVTTVEAISKAFPDKDDARQKLIDIGFKPDELSNPLDIQTFCTMVREAFELI